MFLALIPLVVLSVGWFAHDPVVLFASTVLLVGALTSVILLRRGSWKKNWIPLLPFGVVIGFLVSAIVNGQNLASVYLGGYQRNFGVASWLALSLVFLVAAQGEVNLRMYLDWVLPGVLIAGLGYGLVQFLNKDPLPWANPYDAVVLTLGNPNFAGAFFGILSVNAFSRIFIGKSAGEKVFGFLLFGSTVFISLQTNSLQSPLIIFGGIVIFTLLMSLGSKSGLGRAAKITSGGSLGVVAIAVVVLFTGSGSLLATVREKLFFEGSVAQRLDYWRTGFEIWKDNPLFGVGADQMQRYAALFRTPEQLKRDGLYSIPDKSHNVLIDQFANGGLIVGSIWITFVLAVYYMLFKVLKHNNSTQVRIDLALLGTIWSSYVLQGLISPDQLVLALIGYSSAGLIAGIYFKDAPTLKIDPFIVRSITGVSLIIVIVVSGTVLKVNAEVKKVLDGRIIGGKQILEVIDAWPEAKTTELIGIQEINKLDNCILANQISDRLIKYDDRSAPGWYMKAVCSSARGDFTEALKAVSKSVEFDPINPLYLVGKAKVEIAASRSEEAKSTVARIAKVDPTNPELEMLNVLILGLK
jgi:hypothetical protein